MTQALYAHMNYKTIKIKKEEVSEQEYANSSKAKLMMVQSNS
jgi:hypothetical protein